MNKPPEKDIIEEIALIKGISESFVEKDWYVTQVIKKASEINYFDFQIIFTGGTALSKAHKLLQRFSEDVDFRVIAQGLKDKTKSQQRKILSDFKENIITHFKSAFQIDDSKIIARNGNQFIAIEIDYPTLYSRAQALRPHILIEFTITGLTLPPLSLPVSSFIQELTQTAPEVESIACTDPVENACDKLSAIIWRIPDRTRGEKDDDPDIVRHIHDLANLTDLALQHPGFKKLAIETINRDDQRSAKISGLSLKEKLDTMFTILDNEEEYTREYDRFVKGMSYAPDNTLPTFKEAIEKFKLLANHIL